MTRTDKKKTGKKSKSESKSEGQRSAPVPSPSEEHVADRNDFGGLPMRDLKKNLGCG